MLSFSEDNQPDVIEAFNSTSRYTSIQMKCQGGVIFVHAPPQTILLSQKETRICTLFTHR